MSMYEQTAADLAHNYTLHMMRIWGDEPSVEPLHCQSCGAEVAELLPCTWDTDLLVGKCCVEELPEAECTCVCSGDQADASDCDLHGPRVSRRPPAAAVRLIESADDFLLDEGVA